MSSIGAENLPPIHAAAGGGKLSALRKLLKRGADPNSVFVKEGSAATPIVSALVEGYPECVALLLSHGADPDGKGVDHAPSITPLMISCMLGDARSTELLIKRGATLNRSDPEGFAALHHACHKSEDHQIGGNRAGCVKALLAATMVIFSLTIIWSVFVPS